jgi:hypothetical protein
MFWFMTAGARVGAKEGAVKFNVVVREVGRNTPDYSLEFEAPAPPAVGAWLSIVRPDSKYGHSEDVVVRHVWWKLSHPETEPVATDSKVGELVEIIVECDPALGPHSLDRWRDSLAAARARGIAVAEFDVARFSVREDEMPRRDRL